MSMDMHIEKIKRDTNEKTKVIQREELCYWCKFWNLHYALGLYGKDDYGNDVPMTKGDVERCLSFVIHNRDYFRSFSTVESVCELLDQYDDFKAEGWEIVYNADW